MKFKLSTLSVAVSLAFSTSVFAELDQVSVIGSKDAANATPGAAIYISEQELEKFEYSDINRILNSVSGVYLNEEDGYGLRPNIAIRGSGSERSAKITLMEDGVLIAPAPYASPSAYYFPTAARMQAIEVIKGPSAVKYGPRTTGGAINMVSRQIPDADQAVIDLAGGTDSAKKAHIYGGTSTDRIGVVFEALRQETDGFKALDSGADTGFDKNDYLAKLRLSSEADARFVQEVEFKVQRSDETSNVTYLGLTADDFSTDPYRRYAGSQKDQMNTDQQALSLSHYIQLNENIEVDTVIYRNTFSRNWYKLDKVDGVKIASILADPTTNAAQYNLVSGNGDGSSIFDVKANNRDYTSKGIQSTALIDLDNHLIEVGIRLHEDQMDRYQWIDHYTMDASGNMSLATAGVPGDDSNRIESAEAKSIFVQDEADFGALKLTAGLRYETVKTKKQDWGTSDPDRGTTPTVTTGKSSAFIPGVAFTYQLNPNLVLLGGIHKGWQPAGVAKDSDKDEESTNYEIGLRYAKAHFNGEVIAFYNNYDNLVGTCTASSGADCTIGDEFDGDAVEVKGLEVNLNYTVQGMGA
ncbi:MAG: TonB-dependent receptor, partial [Motiliproteus sp.]|nr:TonB-dependent receptor [Motiliproteus sp.]